MKISNVVITYRLWRVLNRHGIATTEQLRADIVKVITDPACGRQTLVEACALINADPKAAMLLVALS